MRCERTVTLLATGGVLGRWLARRHADHCPNCAAEAARLRRIARELSVVEPLSAAQRALWTSVSSEPRPSPAWPTRYRRVLLAGSTAAVLIAGVVAMIVARRPSPGPGRPLPSPEPSIARLGDVPRPASPATIREIDDLKTKFQALARDVAQLRRRAELLDERRDAEALSRRFDRAVALNVP
jgi:hypothetical protein